MTELQGPQALESPALQQKASPTSPKEKDTMPAQTLENSILSQSFVVTHGKTSRGHCIDQAKEWAQQLRVPYVPRYEKGSLEAMRQQEGVEALLIATEDGPKVYTREGVFFYHPGMGALRWYNMQQGAGDYFATATALQPGQRFLDCTLGLAGDSLIASSLVGPQGLVVGLEASRLLHFVVSHGLGAYKAKYPELTRVMGRIKAYNIEAGAYLRSLPADSFDVIYFDPMFRFTITSSSAMQQLKPLAYEHPLEKQLVQEALRVAPRLVIKERWPRLLRELGCQRVIGGKYARIQYGIMTRE